MKKILGYLPKKSLFTNKWFDMGAGVLAISTFSFWLYLYNPGFMPVLLNSTAKTIGDKIVGQELAQKIDETRDESGATSIRTLFNANKEENLEIHCDKKEEMDKYQEKCWKTYENTEAGYSVKVPVGWVVENEKSNELPSGTLSVVSLRNSESPQIWVEKTARPLYQIEDKVLADLEFESKENLIIGDIQGVKYVGKVSDGLNQLRAITAILNKGDFSYIFYYSEYVANSSDLTARFNDILESFTEK